MSRVIRTYTLEEKMRALALAGSVGARRAGKELDIPVRTVNYWLHQPAASPIIAAAEQDVADMYRQARHLSVTVGNELLAKPGVRLGDVASYLRVVAEQEALAEGRATSRSESVSVNVNVGKDSLSPAKRQALGTFLDRLDAMLAAGDVDGAEREVLQVRAIERQADRLLSAGVVTDPHAAVELLRSGEAEGA
jgi:hypothetical protein